MTSVDPKLTLVRGLLVGASRARVVQEKESLTPERLAFEQNMARVCAFLAKRGSVVLDRLFDIPIQVFPYLATPLAGVMLGARSPASAWRDFGVAEGEAELAAGIQEAELDSDADCQDDDDTIGAHLGSKEQSMRVARKGIAEVPFAIVKHIETPTNM